MSGDGEDEARDIPLPRRPRSSSWLSNHICRPSARSTSSASPRATFYRWYDRYRAGGPEALTDHRSRPDRVSPVELFLVNCLSTLLRPLPSAPLLKAKRVRDFRKGRL